MLLRIASTCILSIAFSAAQASKLGADEFASGSHGGFGDDEYAKPEEDKSAGSGGFGASKENSALGRSGWGGPRNRGRDNLESSWGDSAYDSSRSSHSDRWGRRPCDAASAGDDEFGAPKKDGPPKGSGWYNPRSSRGDGAYGPSGNSHDIDEDDPLDDELGTGRPSTSSHAPLGDDTFGGHRPHEPGSRHHGSSPCGSRSLHKSGSPWPSDDYSAPPYHEPPRSSGGLSRDASDEGGASYGHGPGWRSHYCEHDSDCQHEIGRENEYSPSSKASANTMNMSNDDKSSASW
jgi:hypothetical protein